MAHTVLHIDEILKNIERFPRSPGVYIMRDTQNVPIYIGKAVNLYSRVRSYFFDTHEDRAQIPYMLQKLDHIDWIATNNETEALILEANLIRSNKPKYNIDLRDDKHFPYLKVTVQERFPRLLVVRRVEKDGAKYFGPYTDATAMRKLVSFAKKLFKLRDCNKSLPLQNPIRPCINYSLKICSGACGGKISEEMYRANVTDLIKFLGGKRNDLVKELDVKMQSASDNLDFEKAAEYRDQIQLIRAASKLQQVDLKLADTDCDVFGLASENRNICLAVLHFVDGLLISSRHFIFKKATWEFTAANHDSIFLQFYNESEHSPPQEILIPENAGFNMEILQSWLDEKAPSKAEIIIPQKGTKKSLLQMAEKNARLYLNQRIPPNAIEDVKDLQAVLMLPKLPETIEAFDISNLGQSFAVAGMIQFKEGLPNKSAYRHYKMKYDEGQNDFAMMMEVVTRRLRRLTEENAPFPDLLLIDGGPGQLHAACKALMQFNNPPLIVSLAKKEEILYSPYITEPVKLPQTHPARKLVERIRDEVHRYAITFHRKIRGKQFKTSLLENVDGIGKKKASLLLKTFGSLQRLKEATIEQISQVPGFSTESAAKLLEELGRLSG
jgi:excinuclease ABC subunit C